MPCVHARTRSNIEKVADRRSRTLFRRLFDHNNHRVSCFLEREVPGRALRNSEQRYLTSPLYALEPAAYWKLAPFLPPLQGADRRTPSSPDGHEFQFSQLAIIFSLDVPKEERINLPERTDSAKSVPVRSSSGGVVLGQSHHGNKLAESNNFSSSVSDGLSTVDSDFLVNQTPKGDKSVKRNSRKKGKKKGKQYKRATCKKAFSKRVCCHDSDTATNSVRVCLSERMPENNNSEESSSNSASSVNDASSTTQTPEVMLSIFYENSKNVGPKQKSNFSDNSSSTSSDSYGTPVQDSYLNVGNSCWSDEVINTCSTTERAQCSGKACSSNDFHPVVSGRRGRRARKMTVGASQNGPNRFHSHTGKENNHSVWQRVQKIDTGAPIHETEAINAVAPQGNTSSKGSNVRIRFGTSVGLKQNQSGKSCRNSCSHAVVRTDLCKVASDAVSTSEVASKLIDGKSMHNVRKKTSLAFKQTSHYSRKGSYAAKVNMNSASKNHVAQNEGMPQANHEKHISTGLRSPCSTDFQRLLLAPSDKIGHGHPGPQQKAHNFIQESANNCSTVCYMSSLAACNDIGASSSDSSDQVCLEMASDSSSAKCLRDELCYTDSEENQCVKLETETSHTECGKPDGGTRSVLHKWSPVGRKESEMSNTKFLDNLKVPIVEDSVPLTGGGLPCSSPRVKDKDFSSVGADQAHGESRNHPQAAEESGGAHAASNCRTHEVKNQCFSRFETDLDKMIKAVHDACKLHTVSESARLAYGSSIANFERFIYSASPVIGPTHFIRSCWTCSKEQLIGDSLCLHQIPNISLRSLWQWYEEPGCFGLEVKAQDYNNSKRLHNAFSEFSAYFVPYLSAVQLFGRSRNSRNNSTTSEVAISSEVDKELKTPSSNLCSLPVFSMRLPQPFKESDTCLSESCCCAKDEYCDHLDRNSDKGDEELIFEYFESDQPPWRRPLFEKIKEIIGGDMLSNCRAFGDPLKLESINLHDIHPASWYSVAWYPIYRIPDGKFHAAFLTYHSLGHFVHRSCSSNASDGLGCIVSPIVGLQTYNDKGECWFKLKDSYPKVTQNEEAQFSNPSEILKERMRTLNQTANVMARASVSKGNQRTVNRHPDYEFFLSRSR